MTKDRLQYGLSKKYAHGAEEVERSIGITCRAYAGTAEVQRPVALLKWAFDDFVVEEELPPEAFTTPPSRSSQASQAAEVSSSVAAAPSVSPPLPKTSFVIRVLGEGVPDTVIERCLRERLPRSIAFHFLTPIDFVSSASRYVWLRSAEQHQDQHQGLDALLPQVFHKEQHVHTGAGAVFIGAAQRVCVDPTARVFPPHLLPKTRYTVTLRNIQASLGDVLPQLRSVAQHGFLNYSHVARHGVGLSRIYQDAKLLLQRDYPAFLQHYVQRLSEGTTHVQREMPLLLDVLSSPRSSRQDWRGALDGMELAVKNDAQVYGRTRQSGLYPPHHDLLLDLVRRAADIMPRHRDSAQLIREAVRPLILQETLHAITDVHFNAMASLRWQRGGSGEVQVGDLVCLPCREGAPRGHVSDAHDCFVGAADHMNGAMTSDAHRNWSFERAASLSEPLRWDGEVKRVSSKAEAAAFSVCDVVLPTFGQGIEGFFASTALSAADDTNATLFANLVRELRVDGLSEMRLAPHTALRPLTQRPSAMAFYVVDEKRGWDWEEDAGSTALKKALYHDQDGILRCRSPMARRTGKNMVARVGIRDDVARSFFLKPARKPGMTCVVQLTLPAGCHVTSAIREVFTVATVSPSAIFRLLHR